jgi:hypothetical protein
LEVRVREWLERDPYYYVPEFNSQGKTTLVRVRFTIPPPAEFRLIIGDCLHNLRSALDNLVYELAVQHTGMDPLPENLASGVAFPIAGAQELSPDEFLERYQSKIGLLDPRAQATIEEWQPYHRGEKFAAHPLWKLNRLSNVDKHRVPHITSLAMTAFASFPDEDERGLGDGRHTILHAGPIEDGAVIVRFITPRSEPDAENMLRGHLTFGIAFGRDSSRVGDNVLIVLRWLYHHVANRVVSSLEPFLPR